MKVDLFDFDLPPERIALRPVRPRDAARMLVVRGADAPFEDRGVRDLPGLLNPAGAWNLYIRTWRPGKPHRHTWDAFHQQAQLFNRFTVAAIVCSEPVVTVVRRELRRLFPDLKVAPENLKALIEQEVIKRDTIEGDKAA